MTPPLPTSPRENCRLSFCLALLFVVSAVLSQPLLSEGFGYDQSVFAAIGDTMLKGGIAYRDAWEHKPPGIFYVYYLTFAAISRDVWAVRAVEIVFLALSSVGLFLVVRRRTGSGVGGAMAGVLLPLLYKSFGPNTAQPETFQIPCLVACLYFWPDSPTERHAGVKSLAAGVMMSFAILLKTPIALYAPVLLAERLYLDRREPGGLRARTRLALLTLVGIGAPVVGLIVYYMLRGAGDAVLDALFVFPVEYARCKFPSLDVPQRLEGSIRWLIWIAPTIFYPLAILGIIWSWLVNRLETLRWAGFFLACWATVYLQGRFFEYHHLPLAPALAWCGGLLFSREADSPGSEIRDRRQLLQWGGIAVTAIVTVAGLWSTHSGLSKGRPIATLEALMDGSSMDTIGVDQARFAQGIRNLAQPHETILVWGDQPLLYVLADRRMAGRNCHLLQIVPPWDDGAREEAFLARLMAEPPKVFIVPQGDMLWWREGQSSQQLLEGNPALSSFLYAHYSCVSMGRDYLVWARRSK